MADYYLCSSGIVQKGAGGVINCSSGTWTITNALPTPPVTTTPTLTPQDALLLSGAVLSVWAVSWLYRVIRPTL